MRVLSIDWDYFISANMSERAVLFPDGGAEEVSEYVQDMIWMGRYVDPRLEKIGVEKQAISDIKRILRKADRGRTKYMIADSHKHIYDFILDNKHSWDDNILVANIDFHHDVYGKGSTELHCGNWMIHLMNKYGSKGIYRWIARKDSDFISYPRLNTVVENFSSIEGDEFDLVYICRSGMWSPPHLDEEFKKAFKWIADKKPTTVQQGIFESRYSKEFRKAVKSHREVVGKMGKR